MTKEKRMQMVVIKINTPPSNLGKKPLPLHKDYKKHSHTIIRIQSHTIG